MSAFTELSDSIQIAHSTGNNPELGVISKRIDEALVEEQLTYAEYSELIDDLKAAHDATS